MNKKAIAEADYVFDFFITLLFSIVCFFLIFFAFQNDAVIIEHKIIEVRENVDVQKEFITFINSPIEPSIYEEQLYFSSGHKNVVLDDGDKFSIEVDEKLMALSMEASPLSNVGIIKGSADNIIEMLRSFDIYAVEISWDQIDDFDVLFVGCSSPKPESNKIKNWLSLGRKRLITSDYAIHYLNELNPPFYSDETNVVFSPLDSPIIALTKEGKNYFGIDKLLSLDLVFWRIVLDPNQASLVLANFFNANGPSIVKFDYSNSEVIHIAGHLSSLEKDETFINSLFSPLNIVPENPSLFFSGESVPFWDYRSSNLEDIYEIKPNIKAIMERECDSFPCNLEMEYSGKGQMRLGDIKASYFTPDIFGKTKANKIIEFYKDNDFSDFKNELPYFFQSIRRPNKFLQLSIFEMPGNNRIFSHRDVDFRFKETYEIGKIALPLSDPNKWLEIRLIESKTAPAYWRAI